MFLPTPPYMMMDLLDIEPGKIRQVSIDPIFVVGRSMNIGRINACFSDFMIDIWESSWGSKGWSLTSPPSGASVARMI
jgi:hypothetical protein